MKITNSKPRVLITGFLPPPFSGVGTYYQTLLDSDLKNSIDYLFISTSNQKRNMAKSGQANIQNVFSAISDCIRFTKGIISFRPQVIHIGTAYGLSFVKHSLCVIIAHFFKSKILLHPHCSIIVLYNNRSNLWKWFFRKIVLLTDGILVLSKEWMQLRNVLPNCKFFYLPNPVDLLLYDPVLKKQLRQNKNSDLINVLYLGHLGSEKGSFDIIDAAKIIQSYRRNIIFHLVGSDLFPGEMKLLQEKVERYNLEDLVKFYQPVFGNEKLTFFQEADIFVYPSYHEGQPMAILEAMASGLPIIATNVGGIPDMIIDGVNGILIEPGKPEQIAQAIIKIAYDPNLGFSMKNVSYKIVSEKFDIDHHINRLIKIYSQISSDALVLEKK